MKYILSKMIIISVFSRSNNYFVCIKERSKGDASFTHTNIIFKIIHK